MDDDLDEDLDDDDRKLPARPLAGSEEAAGKGRTKQVVTASKLIYRGKTLNKKKKKKHRTVDGMDSQLFEHLCRTPYLNLDEKEKLNIIGNMHAEKILSLSGPFHFPNTQEGMMGQGDIASY